MKNITNIKELKAPPAASVGKVPREILNHISLRVIPQDGKEHFIFAFQKHGLGPPPLFGKLQYTYPISSASTANKTTSIQFTTHASPCVQALKLHTDFFLHWQDVPLEGWNNLYIVACSFPSHHWILPFLASAGSALTALCSNGGERTGKLFHGTGSQKPTTVRLF